MNFCVMVVISGVLCERCLLKMKTYYKHLFLYLYLKVNYKAHEEEEEEVEDEDEKKNSISTKLKWATKLIQFPFIFRKGQPFFGLLFRSIASLNSRFSIFKGNKWKGVYI